MEPILDAAQRAYDTVALYHRLYPRRPVRGAEVPFISYVAYHHARGPLDCITDLEEALGAVPAYGRKSRRLPVTPLESGEEWTARLNRLLAGLAHLDLPTDDGGLGVLLVADDATGPFAGDLSNGLGWARHRASISYIDGRGGDLPRDIEAFDPDVVLVVTPQLAPRDLAAAGRRVIAVTHVTSEAVDDRSCDRLLVCDELHVLGARRAGARRYRCDATDLVIERVPESGNLAVTTTGFTCLPLIRYGFDRPFELDAGAGGAP